MSKQSIIAVSVGYIVTKLLMNVPLTTISMPVYEMGYKAVDLVVQIVEKNESLRQVILDVSLIERSSVLDINVATKNRLT